MDWRLLIPLLLSCARGLHLKSAEDQQYQALLSQQGSFEQQIDTLNEEIAEFQQSALQTPNPDNYIKLLE